MATNLLKVIEALSSEKDAVLKREEKLVSGLRETLSRLGYQLEAIGHDGASRPGHRARQRRSAPSLGANAVTCSECGRRFALPLHLGRHMSAMHRGAKAPSAPTQSTTVPGNGATTAKQRRRRGMSPAARRAAAKRMKAYWRKRKESARAGTRGRARRRG
jgi:hypothetical protein